MDILVDRLTHRYGPHAAPALSEVSFRIAAGECVALLGASGSGKSTLLRALAGLTPASSGRVRIGGRTVQEAGRLARDIRLQRAHLGVVFQQFNLIGRLTVLTNVLAGALHRSPLWRSLTFRFPRSERVAAFEALRRVGLGERWDQRASTLSGGQQQRAAIARTLLQGARVILGDEPVASLDPGSAGRVLETFRRVNREDGVTCVLALHQVDYARTYCARIIALAAGRIVYDGPADGLSEADVARLYQAAPAAQHALVT